MLFNELQYWVFFALVMTGYVLLPHKAQNRFLLVASYVFYGFWDWRFLGLIMFSTVVDYVIGQKIHHETAETRRKRLLWISLGVNLGLLGVFKYFNFFIDTFAAVLTQAGVSADLPALSIILPVGISFYTFQTLSYTIDIYRRELKPTDDFLDYALFVAFFPQLVAGPIERAKNLLPNIIAPRKLTWAAFERGLGLCLIGLIKKVAIADAIAPTVDSVFASPDPTRADVILACWLFAIQIYCDFSGYTDIARGTAKALGFRLMRNFAQPYFAINPREFWQRWHISLSTWLRDYLYFSLGGSRKGRARTHINLITTMLLGGLWHGAAWNFVLWGAYQGGILSLYRVLPKWSLGSWFGLKRLIGIALFFQITSYGWLLFRADSFVQIRDFTNRLLFDSNALTAQLPPFPAFVAILIVLIWDILSERAGRGHFYASWPNAARAFVYAGLIYLLAFGGTVSTQSFIYFQF